MSDDERTTAPQPPSRKRRIALAFSVTAIVLVLDQATKAWAIERLYKQPAIIIEPGLFQFEFAFNTGSAFGMLADVAWARAFFIIVTALALAYVGRLIWTIPTRYRAAFGALGAIAGGAVGNLVDRLFRVLPHKEFFHRGFRFSDIVGHGSSIQESLEIGRTWMEVPRHGVVDFIVVYYGSGKRWPAFNIADIALTCGVVAFVVFLRKHLLTSSGPDDTESEPSPED